MSVERLDPSRVGIAGGDEAAVRRFIESDYRIRQGLCPNGCGLMTEDRQVGQECQACHFSTNALSERGAAS